MVKLKIYLTFYTIIACVPQLSAKVITPCDSQASSFPSQDSVSTEERTQIHTSNRQQVSISHGGCSLDLDTSLAVSELLIV